MKKLLFCVVIFISLAMLADVSYSQGGLNDETELARKVIQAERRLAIFRVMNLSENEKAGFWSLYDEYIAGMDKTSDRMVSLIRKFSKVYQTLSDELALEMLNELLSIESERLSIKSEYVKKFQKLLPGVKVTRFFQAENKLDAQRDLNLATNIPLAGGIKSQSGPEEQL